MELDETQLQAIQNGEIVPVVVANTECILIRKDVYQKERDHEYDDTDLTEVEISALAAQAFDDADTAGPIP